MKKLILNINANRGYNASQIEARHTLTVGELKSILEGYDDDTPIITKNLDNALGANFGEVRDCDDWEPEMFSVRVYLKNKETGEEIDLSDSETVYECETEEEWDKQIDEIVQGLIQDEAGQKLLEDTEHWSVETEEL